MAANLKELTAGIVASYVKSNAVAAGDLPSLIISTFAALNRVGQHAIEEPEIVAKPSAAQIRKSITPDALISFIDGKRYRMLKRHLTGHGLTPQAYREKWGLPDHYPMVAPNYSLARSNMAKALRLGRKTESAPPAPPEPAGVVAKAAVKGISKTPKREKAGPGARVPKAVRSPKAIAPTGDKFT